MARTIAVSFTLSFVVVATWAGHIVCYHEQTTRFDPLAPIAFQLTATTNEVAGRPN